MPSAITLLARDYKIDVSVDGNTWIPLVGVTDLAESVKPTLQSVDDYDTDGWGASEITLNTWSLVAKFNRKSTAGTKDPGQELLHACQGQSGDAARAYVRWYKREDGSEAKIGRAIVEWSPSKTSTTDVAEITVTLTGDGVLTFGTVALVTPALPVLLTSDATTGAAGIQVTVTGSGLTGATSVKFGATAGTPYKIVSDSTIVVVVPAATAGSTPITVVTPGGTSNALPFNHS